MKMLFLRMSDRIWKVGECTGHNVVIKNNKDEDKSTKTSWNNENTFLENVKSYVESWKLIDFNGMTTHLELFYVERLRNCLHCTLIIPFLV